MGESVENSIVTSSWKKRRREKEKLDHVLQSYLFETEIFFSFEKKFELCERRLNLANF